MLDKHRNLAIPETDTLRVGACVVDVPRREVAPAAGGDATRITVKALQVLLLLVEHRNKVVGRDDLLEWVWPDTMPGDDVLTQAIGQLRRVFGDERGAPRYIETIAKGGYRLIAPVQWLPSADAAMPAQDIAADAPAAPMQATSLPSVDATPAQARMPHRAWLGIAIVAAALVAVAVLAWRDRERTAPAKATAPVATAAANAATPVVPTRITSLPGSEFWPSLSPDGSQVAYSAYAQDMAQANLMVQTTAPVAPHALTRATPDIEDMMAAWSPDGQQIAFMRLGPREECAIMLVPASGGEPRRVASCKRSKWTWMGGWSWHPDGRHLITSMIGARTGIPDDDEGALHTLDLATGTWKRLQYDKAPEDMDLAPQYSPDGRWIVFHRNVSLSDLWRIPAQGGKAERLTSLRTNVYSLAFTPDGDAVVFGSYADGHLQLMRLDMRTRRVAPMGIEPASFPSIAARQGTLAFVSGEPRAALFRFDLQADGRAREPVRMFASTGREFVPSVSPDGSQLVYVSDRTGRLGLWWARPDRPESLRMIDGIVPVSRYPALWSADGHRLLVVGSNRAGLGLYEVAPESGSVRKLDVPDGYPIAGAYLPDPRRLLVVSDRGSGRLSVTLYDRGTQPWRALATLDNFTFAAVDAARGQVHLLRPDVDGLWRSDLDLRHLARVGDRPPAGGASQVVRLKDGTLAYVDGDKGCALRMVPLQDAGTGGTAACLRPGAGGVGAATLDAAHGRLYYTVGTDDTSDIAIVPAMR